MKKIIFILLFLSSHFSYALIDRKGNGGDAVVCRTPQGKVLTAELLDIFESRILYGLNTQSPRGTDATEVAVNYLNNLKRFSPELADYLIPQVQAFMSETRFVPIALVDIDDSNGILLPKDCYVEQLAIQKEPNFSKDKRFTINSEIWNALDLTNKAGLILHEVLYRLAIARGQENSLTTRYFNAFLLSESFLTSEPWQFNELTTEARFFNTMAYSAHGYDFFNVKGKVLKNNFPKSGQIKQLNFSFLDYTGSCQDCYVKIFSAAPDALVVRVPDILLNSPYIKRWIYEEPTVREVVLEKGLVKGVILLGTQVYQSSIPGEEDARMITGYTEFYPNGKLKIITLGAAKGRYFFRRDGSRLHVAGSRSVYLDEDGYYVKDEDLGFYCEAYKDC